MLLVHVPMHARARGRYVAFDILLAICPKGDAGEPDPMQAGSKSASEGDDGMKVTHQTETHW